ncbi:PIF1-like helicase domain containing protein [Elaphomyces granulatus]
MSRPESDNFWTINSKNTHENVRVEHWWCRFWMTETRKSKVPIEIRQRKGASRRLIGCGMKLKKKTFDTHVEIEPHVHSLEEAADFLFLEDDVYNASDVVDRAFLSPFNARVDGFNDLMLRHLPGEETTYFSQDVIKEMDSSSFHIPSANERDLLSMLHEPGVPPHQLSLKVGSIASIMRNLCIERGLVKNARVRITGVQ